MCPCACVYFYRVVCTVSPKVVLTSPAYLLLSSFAYVMAGLDPDAENTLLLNCRRERDWGEAVGVWLGLGVSERDRQTEG